jgi:hypothetical protein
VTSHMQYQRVQSLDRVSVAQSVGFVYASGMRCEDGWAR